MGSSALEDQEIMVQAVAAAAANATTNMISWAENHHHHQHSNVVNIVEQSLLFPFCFPSTTTPSLSWDEREGDLISGRNGIIGSSYGGNDDDGDDRKSRLRVSKMKMKRVKGRKKVREPRFSFKTMTQVDVLDDGYKWRKYGQKVVKNTLHPRSYYRCTEENCKVKKRVERLADDPRMVITTYEGRHAHSPSDHNLEHSIMAHLPSSHLSNFFC